MTLLSMSSCSSVDRVLAMCLGGPGLDSCQGLRYFLCPTLVSCSIISNSSFTKLDCWQKNYYDIIQCELTVR